MKKLIVVAAILALGGTAFAASLNVPWFLDRGAADAAYPPVAQEKSFVTVKNTTSSDITVTISYTSADGTDNAGWTETDMNTFVLEADSSLGWRPGANDPALEGPGQYVPNCDVASPKGGAKLDWAGAATDLQGRVIEVHLNKAFGYLLPAGL